MNDRTVRAIISFFVIAGYLGLGLLLLVGVVPNVSGDLALRVFDFWTAGFLATIFYWIGSSAGSSNKDTLIAGQLPLPQAHIPPTPSPTPAVIPQKPQLPPALPPPAVQTKPTTSLPHPPPAADVLTITGKMSHFGGPADTGVGPDEGLALCELGEESKFPGLFLPGTGGLARRLDPTKHYVACRWDYKKTPRSWLQKTKVSATANGITVTDVQPIDWGPNEHTGRVADLSPGLESALGLATGDTVTISFPLQQISPAPQADETVADGLTRHVWPLQSECAAFYGDPNSAGWEHANLVEVQCPWPLQIDGKTINTISIHSKCADSLREVLEAIWEACGRDVSKISALRYDRYDGSFNLRPMRGGSALSMHAYGCALDIDASDNPFHSETGLFTTNSIIVQKFEAAGWIWGGRWMSPDKMHFQAARVHP